jgi:hypothetical protein
MQGMLQLSVDVVKSLLALTSEIIVEDSQPEELKQYRFFHESLRDFFIRSWAMDELGLEDETIEVPDEKVQYVLKETDEKIVAYCLEDSPVQRDATEYPLRFVCSHLFRLADHERLYQILHAETGHFYQARKEAEAIPYLHDKFKALSSIAALAMTQAEDVEQSKKYFHEALMAAKRIDASYLKSEGLTALASALKQPGYEEQAKQYFHEVLTATRAIKDDQWKTRALRDTILAIAEADEFQQAYKAAKEIESSTPSQKF